MEAGKFHLPSKLLLSAGILCLVGASLAVRARIIHAPDNTQIPIVRTIGLQRLARDSLEGDLIFRSGRDMVSHMILAQSNTQQFSHVGIIMKRDGHTFVAHAIPSEEKKAGGVVLEPLEVFASEGNTSGVGLYRDKSLGKPDRDKISKYAERQIGKPFDNEFSFADDSEMYCTELAIKAYMAADKNLASDAEHSQFLTITEPVVVPDALSASLQLHSVMLYSEGQHTF